MSPPHHLGGGSSLSGVSGMVQPPSKPPSEVARPPSSGKGPVQPPPSPPFFFNLFLSFLFSFCFTDFFFFEKKIVLKVKLRCYFVHITTFYLSYMNFYKWQKFVRFLDGR
jgi:hypothetical protein